MHGPSDTSPEVERLMVECYRRMPVWKKLVHVALHHGTARRLHAAGHRLRNPGAAPADACEEWGRLACGDALWHDLGKSGRTFRAMHAQPDDQVRPVRFVTEVLDFVGIPYAIGGSLASSAHGVPRYTQDADLMVEPFPGREPEFAECFPPADFYVDVGMVRDAVARRASFNVLYLPTAFKIDFFVRKDRPFDRSVMGRRVSAPVFGEGQGEYRIITPEDSVLLKLEWYRLGGETSDRQWGDVLGVLKVQAGRLDDGYLDRWAAELGVADLLGRVRAGAGAG